MWESYIVELTGNPNSPIKKKDSNMENETKPEEVEKITSNKGVVDQKSKIPEGHDAVYLIFGYDEDHKYIAVVADADWSYREIVNWREEPDRIIVCKKRKPLAPKKTVSMLFVEKGKMYGSVEEANKATEKRKFF